MRSSNHSSSPEVKGLPPFLEQLKRLATKKNIEPAMLLAPADIKLSDDMSVHTAWAFNAIYKFAYPNHKPTDDTDNPIARFHHGIQHTTRVAMYIPVFANLYRRYGDAEAMQLTPEDIKLLQIAALFHDSAREGEKEDDWDLESGIFLYGYLTRVLKVDAKKAKLIVEATANKDAGNPKQEEDATPKKYYQLVENEKGEIKWEEAKTIPPKNIYQKLIHDADSLDIRRVIPDFDAEFLDFYQQFALHNRQALDELAELIMEEASLIESQGDSYWGTFPAIKKQYENENAYQAVANSIFNKDHDYPILRAYSLQNGKLRSPEELKKPVLEFKPYDKTKGLTLENLKAALNEGRVIARGISTPSAVKEKPERKNEFVSALELRKVFRRPHIETRSQKENRLGKEGNPLRSGSLLGWGGVPFSCVGFLSIDFDIANVAQISGVDLTDEGSGFHKKTALRGKEFKETKEEKQTQLHNLLLKQKKGGQSISLEEDKDVTHSEIIYHVKHDYEAIYFTNDPVFANQLELNQVYPFHPHSPVLQAIFLKNEYEHAAKKYAQQELAYAEKNFPKESKEYEEALKKYHFYINKKLPIIEYSGIHNTVKFAPEFSNDDIKKMWVEICSSYMHKLLEKPFKEEEVERLSLTEIKIGSMYGKINATNGFFGQEILPADANYDEKLREEIDAEITRARSEILAQKRKNQHPLQIEIRRRLNALNTPSDSICALLKSNEKPDDLKDIYDILEHKEIKSFLSSTQDMKKSFCDAVKVRGSRVIEIFGKEVEVPLTFISDFFMGLKILLKNNLLTQENIKAIVLTSPYSEKYAYNAELICNIEKKLVDPDKFFLTSETINDLLVSLPKVSKETIFKKFSDSISDEIDDKIFDKVGVRIYKNSIIELLLKNAGHVFLEEKWQFPPAADRSKNFQKITSLLLMAVYFDIPNLVAKIIADEKVDLNKQDNDGYTLLHHCIVGKHDPHEKIIKLLLKQGADITIKDKSGKAPFDYLASKRGIAPFRYEKIKLDHINWIYSEIERLAKESKQETFRKLLADIEKFKEVNWETTPFFYERMGELMSCLLVCLNNIKEHSKKLSPTLGAGLFEQKSDYCDQLYSLIKTINNELTVFPHEIPNEKEFKFIEPVTKFPKELESRPAVPW